MDFLPGFLLINIEEYNNIFKRFKKRYTNKLLFPFLVNYSSDFYIMHFNHVNNTTQIYIANNDDTNLTKIHNSFEEFLKTEIAFYHENVYFLDEDGYLDMDFDKYTIVGQKLNPNIEFWFEE